MQKKLLILFCLLSINLFAQTTVETKLVVTQNDGNSGGSFKVSVQAKGTNLTGDCTLGSATIDVYYNASHIAPVITTGNIVAGTYDATIGNIYTRILTYVSGGPYVRLTIAGSNINGNGDGTPTGFNLTSDYQTLATINFTISNNTVSTNLNINSGTLTIGLFDSPNNSNFSGIIIPQIMSAPENISNILLPVELSSLSAAFLNNKVNLNWSTQTEVNNYGFEIERFQKSWEKIGFVEGHGNSNNRNLYSFSDISPIVGDVQYRIKQIDNDGNFKYYDAITVAVNEPKEYKLMQNSPNPFNPSTAIKFQLPKNEFVTVKIYDQIGREVTTLINEEKPSGSHIVYWNGRDSKGQAVSSGVYLYKLTAGSYIQTRKMNLLK